MIGQILSRMLFVTVLFVVAAEVVAAQDAPPTQQDSTELSFERETFSYPQYARRNPFAALLAAEGGGPRFERIILLGIVYSENGGSVAVLGEGSRTFVSETETTVDVTGPTFSLRVGETVGNTTIREIQRRHVVVEVEEFGLTETRIMEMPNRTTGQGGPE
jgi:hypothetical protein